MNELNVPFTEEDLHKPTAPRMQMVYEAFADLLMGYTRETFENSIVACESQVDNFVWCDEAALRKLTRIGDI